MNNTQQYYYNLHCILDAVLLLDRPSVTIEPLPPTTPVEGITFTLLCRVTSAKPAEITKYVWKKNSKKLTADSDKLVLTLLNASQHDGNYTCRAKNEAGISPPMTSAYTLNVHCE